MNAIADVNDIKVFIEMIKNGESVYDLVVERLDYIRVNYFSGWSGEKHEVVYAWNNYFHPARSTKLTKAVEMFPNVPLSETLLTIFQPLKDMCVNIESDSDDFVEITLEDYVVVFAECFKILNSIPELKELMMINSSVSLQKSIDDFERYINGGPPITDYTDETENDDLALDEEVEEFEEEESDEY